MTKCPITKRISEAKAAPVKQQKHREIVGHFMNRIFDGTLKAGEKLPTEKQLCADMQVDRGSLRVALKQLEAMNVLDIRHGDGMYVKDYVKNAGIDFLGALLQQQESGDDKWIRDGYFFDEMWEFWMTFLPSAMELAAKRFSIRDVRALIDLLERQKAAIGDRAEVVELEVQSQDKIAEIVDNTILLLFYNSSRPLRVKMTEIYFDIIGEEEFLRYNEMRKAMLMRLMSGSKEEAGEALKAFRVALAAIDRTLKERRNKGPAVNKNEIT